MKIFRFTICTTYQQTAKKTWEHVISGFEKVLYSRSSRTLDSLRKRVEVVRTFGLSKLYYEAQVQEENRAEIVQIRINGQT